ncbi:MAG TPA: SDR family oxidoreductase [Patescibacteria group bacterium]|nr:SDR family oxidoreductase [Patescibacteria group bacterium]
MKAIVTGGNRGIGLEITRRLAAGGFQVHVLSRSGMADPAEAGVTDWTVDLADDERVLGIAREIGPVDVLINNAGMMNTKTAVDYDIPEILQILQVNLISAVRLSVHVAETMAANGGGRIVSVGSIAGQIGHPDIWYGISKAGLMNAMRSLARSHGVRGVIANAVAPGPVETDMMAAIPVARKDRLKAATIAGRFATAGEVADTVCWLATQAPAYINGEVIDMNNGSNYR